ncbi:MAG: dual specificity protein phosphatase family protein [Anaerolineales bacterium]|nr:dual specificity protein phosphatase family protein [Anaerolineales bacterium]
MNTPIPDSYWVRPGQLLAGEYPRTPDEAESRLKLRRFLAAAVNFFLNLTEADEYSLKPYHELLQREAASGGYAVEHHRLAIPDFGIPTPAQMIQILDTIETALAEGQIVYVHCFGGIGRTGTVIGCYLVRHGLSGEAALAEIARLRQNTPDGRRPSPETEAQRGLVQGWEIGE